MKKKYLSIIVILCAFLITACSTNNNETTPEKNTDTQQDAITKNDTDSENATDNESDNTTKNNANTETSSAKENSSLKTENDSKSVPSDNTSDTTSESPTQENSALQSSQPSNTPEDYYHVCTSFTAQEVESFASNVKAQILARDWEGLSENLSYPITINGNTCADSTDFLALDIDSKISQDFLDAIEAETCQQMFCNYEGISMGAEGQIWINELSGSSELKVTAINGMFGW